jgi:hypothetical protein
MVRGKFQVTKIAKTSFGSTEITLSPNYDNTIPEDQKYAKATPSGTIQMTVDNPPAVEYLNLGEYFYVDFMKVT